MVRFSKASLGAIALTLGGLSLPTASSGADRVEAASARAAERASKALSKRETDKAIMAAEQAVALSPRTAQYRMLLGQSYLQAGRFQSAAQAFGDTLALDGGNGRAALNLALTQIAGGQQQTARATLDAHVGDIPTADRGLALALAGDTRGAVAVLTLVARSPDASPKVRQNLALSYALAGEWGIARVVAAADMSPADVDTRLEQWAAFAQPRDTAEQVASLLGVRPVADSGQPVGLALNAPAATAVAAAEPAPVVVPAPVQVAAVVVPVKPIITFAAPKEVVQVITPAMIASQSRPYKTPIRVAVRSAPKSTPARGNWYVQLGAFGTPEVAKDGWVRAGRRYAALKTYTPRRADLRSAKSTLHLLSVGGFTRTAAKDVCSEYRSRGGSCFIRSYAGEQLKAWLGSEAKQVAMK